MTARLNRMILIVLDGVGVGAMSDASEYGDAGANTLAHVADAVGGLIVPTLESLGLGHVGAIAGVPATSNPDGCFGRMAEAAKGKDSIAGHWELTGVVVNRPFPTYPRGFPPDVLGKVEQVVGRKLLGNRAASGTAIIDELGEEHVKTGAPILYTSADSVLQLAAHQEVIPPAELYRMCRGIRKVMTPPHQVGRVIARPFSGSPGHFVRIQGRRDFALEAPEPTVLDVLKRAGHTVVGIGKVDDLFAGRGLTRSLHAETQADVFDHLERTLATVPRGFIVVNFVEFDSRYGHRKDAVGFADALQRFDNRLPDVLGVLRQGDCLMITADHGNDPVMPGTDHSREYVPLLAYGPRLGRGVNLGTRKTFADVGQTVADGMGVGIMAKGESFLDALQPG